MPGRSPTLSGWHRATGQVIEYPEGHHTLEFDPEPSRYALDLVAWLDRQFHQADVQATGACKGRD